MERAGVGRVGVLLALEPLMLRELLQLAIAGDREIRVVADISGGRVDEVVDAARRTRPRVAVVTMVEPGQISPAGAALLAQDPALTVLLLSDRVAGALVCRGSPPRCRGLALSSVDQILEVLRDARRLAD